MRFIRSINQKSAVAISCILFLIPQGLCGDEASWPQFQGPPQADANGGKLPTRWSTDENVAWTATLPGYGQSSPVIWGNLLVLTSIEGPEKETGIVVGLDKQTGNVSWKKEIQKYKNVLESYKIYK